MHYGEIKYFDIANGPGIRVSLFVSGCPHACKGCFNEASWNPSFGEVFTEEVEERILQALDKKEIQGLTLLGGEPLVPENLHALLPLLRKMKECLPEKDLRLLFRGSRNQRLISIPKTLKSGKICLYAE